jgi:type VI secretion system protein ImpE
MIAKQLFEAGRVKEAEQALSAHLRDHPTDAPQRTFLFELLCFSGEFDRAEKHVHMLSQGGHHSELAAVLYLSALHAEKTRHELFQKQAFPQQMPAPSASVSGALNGKPFTSITDADPEIGPRLEIFAGGSYLWLPFAQLASLRIEPPKRLRDTLWAPAFAKAATETSEQELGEVLIPMIYPFSWKCEDEVVWLGRTTAWGEDDKGNEYPLGQKLLIVDGKEVPFLEVRTLEFEPKSS